MKRTTIIFMILAMVLSVASFVLDFTQTKAQSSGFKAWGVERQGTGKSPKIPNDVKELLSKNNGIWLGDESQKKLYLTFDCGYEAGYTPKILDALEKTGVKAVFFVTGQFASENPDLIKRINEIGSVVGNHTNKHIVMPNSTDEKNTAEIKELENKVQATLGDNYQIKFIRPPKGEYSEKTLKLAQNLGYKTVFWSSAYVDWTDDKKGDLDYAFNWITKQFHNGSIILLHNTSQNNADVLERVITEARNQGYEFGDLSEI